MRETRQLLGCHDSLHILLTKWMDCALELTWNSEFSHHHMQDFYICIRRHVVFGGLGVACWPLEPKFAGSNPAEAVGFLRTKKKILITSSFGGEVKPPVPCRRFAACKKNKWRGSRHFGKITGQHFSPTVPPFAAGISHVVVDVEAPGDESGNV